jgi:N-acetylglucosaminyldiphosphoundecaprenol N-acetyl-beta-D-mannosaminyltransferase
MNGSLPTLNVLGVRIAAISPARALSQLGTWLRESQHGRYICITGVHGVMESVRNPRIRSIHNHAAMCVPDGMPLTWVGRIRGRRNMDRVYGPDLMMQLLELSVREGWSHFFYGGAPGVADKLSDNMRSQYPGLRVVGTHCPPYRALTSVERTEILNEINRAAPDIVWIGLSTPKQEALMSDFSPDIKAKLMLGVGAAFDFHTGRIRQSPCWIQRIGMEWFFRLCMEPRRLTGRYLRNNPAFLWLIALQLLGLRKFPFTSGAKAATHKPSA